MDVQVPQECAEPSAGVGVHVRDWSACGLVLAQVVQGIAKILGGGGVESQLDRLVHVVTVELSAAGVGAVSRRMSVAHRPGAVGGRGGLPPAGLAAPHRAERGALIQKRAFRQHPRR